MNPPARDFNSISPSAKSLLRLKSFTEIPFARQVADLLQRAGSLPPGEEATTLSFWLRAMHFEERYWSIDQLLPDAGCANVLELSSGYSFRGLDLVHRSPVQYVDTDLPEVVATKQQLLANLRTASDPPGRLTLLPLNPLEEGALSRVCEAFPEGPVAIVNEGLLMYLGAEERAQLGRNIAAVLARRGGCWITADVYLRTPETTLQVVQQSEATSRFLRTHRVDENKFASFPAAEAFFSEVGLAVEQEAAAAPEKLATLRRVRELLTEAQASNLGAGSGFRKTWRLKVREPPPVR
jgi:O-methyltransferase involved in polyketide biosynthesis